ncbi:MAG: nuclear transport factor 2 family protein [Chloroflexi bacterium]|nr:nuclear transport factor 2 family protein [Chloroflexota bacterium]
MASIEDAIRQSTDALNRGDVERFLSFHTNDVVIHFPGRSPLAGDHRGQEAARKLIQGQTQAGGTTEIHDILSSGEHAVLLGLVRFTPPGGQPIEDRQVIVLHHREGKFSEVWIYPENQYGLDEMIAQAPR